MKVEITVHSGGQTQTFLTVPLPLELGRENRDDLGWLSLQNLGDRHRIAIAPRTEVNLSRVAIRIIQTGESITVENAQEQSSYLLADQPLEPLTSRTISDPVQLQLLDNLCVHIGPILDDSSSLLDDLMLRTLEATSAKILPLGGPRVGKLGDLLQDDPSQNAGQVAVGLVRQALDVVRKSAGSDEFFESAARNTAAMIELDRAYVLDVDGAGGWIVRAAVTPTEDARGQRDTVNQEDLFEEIGDPIISPEPFAFTDATNSTADNATKERDLKFEGSREVLRLVLEKAKTVIYEPSNFTETVGSSLMTLDRAVAAPIFDEKGEVIGILYGDRKLTGETSEKKISDLEAALLEVMAGAVAAGLARQKEESLRAAMGQFFSSEVTERLTADESLLAGRDVEVTVMFCDIRRFSGITERIGPKKTIEWMNDVLTELSQCVVATDGVLVDYIGDELMAMWGAPADQPDHAILACKSAIEMVEKTELLRQRWEEITPDGFGFGIGINTGIARVGNTGSRLKFKYGPLGGTVNVASRIQGMTKKFGVRILVAQSTYDAVQRSINLVANPDDNVTSVFNTRFRHLADVQPLGVKEVLAVHELGEDSPDWEERCDLYQEALNAYHLERHDEAVQMAGALVHRYPHDGPVVRLLGRIIATMTSDVDFDPVVRCDSK